MSYTVASIQPGDRVQFLDRVNKPTYDVVGIGTPHPGAHGWNVRKMTGLRPTTRTTVFLYVEEKEAVRLVSKETEMRL